MIFILREKVHIMKDNYCLCCGKKISNEQGKIKELNDTTFIPLICKVKNFITCNKETSKLVLNEKYICENCMTKINKVLFKRRFIFNIAISLWLSFGEIAILLIFMFLIK